MNTLHYVFEDFPNTLSNCQNLDGDLAIIADWATIFSHFLKEAGKNYALHRKTINGDIADE